MAKSASKRKFVLKVIAYAVLVAVCLAMALLIGDSDNNATAIGWMPLLALVILTLLSYFYVVIAQHSLAHYESTDMSYCVRGEKIPLAVEFQNKSPLILLNVKAELFVADMNGDTSLSTTTSLTLGPFGSCEIPFEVPLEHIGMFEAGLKSLVISDFLGLFSRKIEVDKSGFVCVTPKVPNLSSIEFSDDSEVENFKMLKTALADSLDYAYVREYEPGDPLKTIHWKLSARNGEYLTRLFEKTVSPGVVVVLDFYAQGENVDEAMTLRDIAIESALAVADYARSRGMETELRYANRFNEYKVLGKWDEEAMLELIKEMPQSAQDDAVREQMLEHLRELAISRTVQNNLVVCSANVESDMMGALISAKQARKSPFFICSVPHRLVDRDLEKYLMNLSALDGYRIGYQHIAASAELEGRDL